MPPRFTSREPLRYNREYFANRFRARESASACLSLNERPRNATSDAPAQQAKMTAKIPEDTLSCAAPRPRSSVTTSRIIAALSIRPRRMKKENWTSRTFKAAAPSIAAIGLPIKTTVSARVWPINFRVSRALDELTERKKDVSNKIVASARPTKVGDAPLTRTTTWFCDVSGEQDLEQVSPLPKMSHGCPWPSFATLFRSAL